MPAFLVACLLTASTDATEQATQEDVYSEVRPLVESALDGCNVCILAYGQTGAGKTFTMEGVISAPGIAAQAMTDVFRMLTDRGVGFTVAMSVLEVYNDTLRDQLAENGAAGRLEIKQTGDGGVHIPDLSEVEVTSQQEVASLIRTARRNRATFATNLNKHSSRSHSILSVRITTACRVTG
jgi:kinesin family protein C2/C3